eukprot:704227-Ditylum_brightwellii.AAC.1
MKPIPPISPSILSRTGCSAGGKVLREALMPSSHDRSNPTIESATAQDQRVALSNMLANGPS